MWICLNDAFFSIVEDGSCRPDQLLVRARRKGDIENVFVEAKGTVEKTIGRDYLYRAKLDRDYVADVIADKITDISYPNFKGSVRDPKLANAYSKVWSIHADLQEIPPYSTANKRGRLL